MPRGNNPLVPFFLIYLEKGTCWSVFWSTCMCKKQINFSSPFTVCIFSFSLVLLFCPPFFFVGRLVGLIPWEKLPRTNRGSWTKLLERNLAQAGSGTRFLEECFGQFYMAYSVFLWPFWLNHARFWYGWKKMRSLLSCTSWCQSCPRPLELMTSEVMHARLCSKENWRESSALKL